MRKKTSKRTKEKNLRARFKAQVRALRGTVRAVRRLWREATLHVTADGTFYLLKAPHSEGAALRTQITNVLTTIHMDVGFGGTNLKFNKHDNTKTGRGNPAIQGSVPAAQSGA